jgi:predicted amidohydrolase YtcJ
MGCTAMVRRAAASQMLSPTTLNGASMTSTEDIVILNASIRTVDQRDAVAEAATIRDGRFVAVGPEAQARAAASAGAQIVNVGGRTVIPGLIDPHNHLSIAAFAPDSVDFSTTSHWTLDEVLRAIEDHCKTIPAGQWVRGMRFNMLQIDEKRGPARTELDEVAPNNPFFLIDASCHRGWANSRALAEVGIDAHTPQPWGGQIEKGSDGEPTGTMIETATNLLHSASWNDYAERDWDRAVTLLHAKINEYLAVGLTGVGDAMVTAKAAELYRRAHTAGKLSLTVQQLHHGDHFFAMQDLRRFDIVEQIKEASTKMLRGGTLKIYVDAGYPDGPAIDKVHGGCKIHVGSSFYSRADVLDLATRASDLGIKTAIHAMGNCAVDTVLDAYEAVRRRSASDAVLRLEHAFVAEPLRQGARMAELGIDLVANPGLGYAVGAKFARWRGENQPHLRVLPVRSMIDAGVRVSLASDHPCAGYSPFEIMWAAITRATSEGGQVDPDEAITAAEALRLYTINAAHASDRADEEGSIEVGKRANLLVLDRDIIACATDEIQDTQVDLTFVDGQLVHERTGR